MAEAALKEVVHQPVPVRRFEIADLSKHGPWLIKRFMLKFPNFTDRAIGGYLTPLVYDNAHLFLFQPHAVALAQLVHTPGIRPIKIVQERFVWVEDRNDKEQLEHAADFYGQMQQWAKGQDAERIVVCEDTDVPKPLIEARLGRVFDTKISYVRM